MLVFEYRKDFFFLLLFLEHNFRNVIFQYIIQTKLQFVPLTTKIVTLNANVQNRPYLKMKDHSTSSLKIYNFGSTAPQVAALYANMQIDTGPILFRAIDRYPKCWLPTFTRSVSKK